MLWYSTHLLLSKRLGVDVSPANALAAGHGKNGEVKFTHCVDVTQHHAFSQLGHKVF